MDIESQTPVLKQIDRMRLVHAIPTFTVSVFQTPFALVMKEYFAVLGFYFGVLVFIALGTFAIVPAGTHQHRDVTRAIWYYSMALVFGMIVAPFMSCMGNLIGACIDWMLPTTF